MAHKRYRVAILGDGGWGTALAVVNARRGNEVMLWSAFPAYAETLKQKRENIKFLPGVPLDSNIQITSRLEEAIEFGQIVVLAIPTKYLRNVLHKIKEHRYQKKVLVSVAKGIENKTLLRPSEIIYSILGADTSLVVLSGPSHAEEVARAVPTLVVSASNDQEKANLVRDAFCDTYFRIYIQTDIVGAEFGGALKNVVAIAAGICDGLGYGVNTKSGLLSRGLLEMMRLGVRYGANPNTFFGLAGLGDLITTCFSEHGRNLKVGRELGKGKKISEILKGMEMVAEGVDTAISVHELCEKGDVQLPIMNEVYQVVCHDKDPKQTVQDLLGRGTREEWRQYS